MVRVRNSRRWLAMGAVLVIAVTGLVVIPGLADYRPAGASHYRANQINWHTTATPGEVEFHLTGSWRLSFYWYESAPGQGDFHPTPVVGDVFQPTQVGFGDGGWFGGYWRVTFVDAANDVVSAEAHVQHVYNGAGPWLATIEDCCRLSNPVHRNNPNGDVRVASHVAPAVASASPVSGISPIVECGLDVTCKFFVPATAPSGQSLSFRLSGTNEAGFGFVNPDDAGIDPATGLYSWDTTGADLNPDCAPGTSCDSFFSTQVIIEARDSSGALSATTPVDFFIRVTDSPNQPPVFVSPTPADGTVIFAPGPNEQVKFTVAAKDPDPEDTVSLAVLGAPAGASFTTAPGNPASGVFSWVPSKSGTQIVTLVAADPHGRGALQRSVTIDIPPATHLTANPVVAQLIPSVTPTVGTDGKYVWWGYSYSGIYVNLSSNLRTGPGSEVEGLPIYGLPVSFYADSKKLCTAKTDSNGTAECTGKIDASVQAAAKLGYTAKFAGDRALRLGRSSAKGEIVGPPSAPAAV